MISDAAYSALKTEASKRANSTAVLSVALRLYQENYVSTQLANPTLPRTQIETLLLMPISVISLLDQSEVDFKRTAKDAMFSERVGRYFWDAIWNIAMNLIASVLFVLISIGAYIAMQDTAQNALRSLGIVVQSASEQKDTAALPATNANRSGTSNKPVN